MSNLLAQGKEIKRLKKEDERRQREAEEVELERGAEEKERAIEQFERTMMGLEGDAQKAIKHNGPAHGNRDEVGRGEGRGVKRKFELDEDEMLKNAKAARAKAREALDEEKVLGFRLYSVTKGLTFSSPLSPRSLPSGFPHSLPLQTIHKIPGQQSYRLFAQPHPQRTNTLFRSNR